ncbi:Gfo/Idh/MocA family protein [Saliphagus infecundisoli]|uniref:Gfo/Idh/MocA family protein n=1 Tax=Saliphagus infecundisoli TaxID=1849069 RepID=A0ABD5Q9Y0_9EURY|nr:Gfo/Idh/MocA family oxidoreductase [Saliphagus infecundisoli]
MSAYTIGIVGTGPDPDRSDHGGYSMGYRHAEAYEAVEGCRLVACADVVADHARDFGEAFGLDEGVFTDVGEMLATAEPDVVSVCTPPATHADLVAQCAGHDAVRAVHCEKPMAPTYGESHRMVEVCDREGVQFTVNLQNRCAGATREIKERVAEGAIGNLRRIELARRDLLQTGIHHVDVANCVAGDPGVEWIMGQIDYPEEHVWYTDMHTEAQALGMWRYESGGHALCSTGGGAEAVGNRTNRFLGTDGEIEFRLGEEYRIRTDGAWETVAVDARPAQEATMAAVVAGLDGEEPPIAGERGLAATEIVFGIWESARRRGRVEPPLEIEDNPLEAMVDAGDLPP